MLLIGRPGLGYHVVDYGLQIACVAEDFQLAVGTRSLLEHGVDVADFTPASEFVEDVVDEGEVLEDQFARGDLLLLAEVNHLAVEAVADCAKLVLHQQRTRVLAIVDIF